MPKLIGITGKARSGKDTLGAALVARGYKRVSFADALKRSVAIIAGEPEELYFDDASKEEVSPTLGVTRRSALQKVGNSMREVLNKDVWIRRALLEAGDSDVVITDVRYDNEAQAVRLAGGIVVGLSREGAGLRGEAAHHVSEKPISIDLIDEFVINDGTIEDLKKRADKLDALAAYCSSSVRGGQ